MWKKIKQTTSRTVELVKKKGGAEMEKSNPEYALALERYNDIKNHILVFIENITKILDPINKVGQAVGEVSRTICHDLSNLETAQDQMNQFKEVTDVLTGTLEESVAKRVREEILQPLKNLEMKFREYSRMKDEHKNLNLLLSSNKEKLERLQKANKKPDEIQNYQNKVSTKSEQLDQMEAQFIGEITEQWDNRFNSLYKPYIEFNKFLYEYVKNACEASQSLQYTLSDVLSQEFET